VENEEHKHSDSLPIEDNHSEGAEAHQDQGATEHDEKYRDMELPWTVVQMYGPYKQTRHKRIIFISYYYKHN